MEFGILGVYMVKQYFSPNLLQMKTKRSCMAASPFLLCLLFAFCSSSLSATSFRSIQSGSWQDLSIWQVWNGSWQSASDLPGSVDHVLIQAGHTVSIIATDALVGHLHVSPAALLRLQGASYSLSIDNGNPSGSDFLLEGTFEDFGNSASGNGIFFINGATWQMGANATLVKSGNSSAARYRDHYEGGMQTIPPTAHWIVRYMGSGHPSFSTNDTYYPNLTFESWAGHWSPAIGASRFQGSAGFATILGNLNVGGSGSGSVTIFNQNTNATGLVVKGNTVIQSGSTLTNQGNVVGTGFQFGGSLLVHGNLDVSLGTTIFDGFSAQPIQGAGSMLLSDVELNNSSGIDLYRYLEINGNLSLWQGHFRLNAFDLKVVSDIVGASSWTYVKTNGMGYLNRPFVGSQSFPIGNDTYNMTILEGGFSNEVGMRVEDRVLEEASWGHQILDKVVNRTWWVEGNISNYSLTVEWSSVNELSNFDRNSCYFSHHSGSGWEQQATQGAIGINPYLLTQNELPGPGAFAIASNGILPLQLIEFYLSQNPRDILLKWMTEDEFNFDYFEVQKSTDGYDFEPIAQIQGKGGLGNQQHYQFQDKESRNGTFYYRLKMLDLDGRYQFSDIIVVHIQHSQEQITFLVEDQLRLAEVLGAQAYLIVNQMGQCLSIPFTNSHYLAISHLPKGMYWILTDNQVHLSFIKH